MFQLWSDIRYSLRQLRKSPGFTFTAIAALALGIGANTAIFTVFNQVLLSKLPVHKPEELVLLSEHSKAETGRLSTEGWDEDLTFTYPGYQELRDRGHVFSGLAAVGFTDATLVTAKDAAQVNMGLVTGNYFSVLGVRPTLGRLLLPSDDILHAGNPVIVLSEDYWRSHFGSDPAILNQVVHINKRSLTVVGVAQHRGFMDQYPFDIFVPLSLEQAVTGDGYDRLVDPLDRWLIVFGRPLPGVTRTQVLAKLNPIWLDWRREVLTTMSHHIDLQQRSVWLESHIYLRNGDRGVALLEGWVGGILKVLEGMALIVLLIACANVANLFLVKTARRYGELAVRGALGASRGRILQQVLTEGLLLGLMGAFAGLPLAAVSLQFVLKLIPKSNALHSALIGKVDWRILLFCAALGILTSILFSVAPAFVSTKINLIRALHLQSGGSAGNSGLRNGLVSSEIALSMTLLVTASVFGWTLYQLHNINPGFTPARLWTFDVDASALGKNDAEVRNEYESIANAIRRQPGVRSVTFAKNGLITGSEGGSDVRVVGYPNHENDPVPDRDYASPGFFSTMQIPLLAGREFTDQDRLGAQKVAVVDEAFVKHFFAGNIQAALAGSFGFGSGHPTDIQIVGVIPVVHAVKLDSLPSTPFLYLPYDQTYAIGPGQHNGRHEATFYIRTTGKNSALPNSIRRIIHDIDANLPVEGLETMGEHINDRIFETRLMTALAISISTLALLLAAIGLYGVLSFSVAQRTKEIGIRMALGASRENISTLVVRQVGYLIGGGMAAGTALGWLAVHLLRSQVSNLRYGPIWLFAAAAFGLMAVMLLAGFLPARRAASVEPMEALRAE